MTARRAIDLGAAPDLAQRKSPAAFVAPLPEIPGAHDAWRSAIVPLLAAEDLEGRAIVAAMAAELDDDSRDRVALELLARWEAQKFHGRFGWVAEGLALLGRDRTAIALEPLLVRWPKESDTGRRRAIEILPVFRRIGTDTALLVLLGLGQKQVLPSVFEAAQRTLKEAAHDRKTSVWELGDVITPSCGLDRDGRRVFDLGTLRAEVWLDEHFEPRVRAGGELLDALPEGDAARTAIARAEWEHVSRQLAEVTKVQTARLEEAMVVRWRWSARAWREHVHGHPLMIHYVRRLVWGVFDEDDLVRAFRGAEDRSLVDLEGDTVDAPSEGRIGIVHPLDLDAAARARWGEHLGDYEVISPFAQMGRTMFTVRKGEIESLECTRYADTRIDPQHLHDWMIQRHWLRDQASRRRFFEKEIGERITAMVRISPGLMAGRAAESGPQTIDAIEFRVRRKPKKPTAKGRSVRAALGEVPPVAFSEALLDAEHLATTRP